MKYLTRTIWVLSFVSLFADAASEMLYPVMPMFLKSIGFSVLLIGVLEGIAEAVAGLSKGYFGKLSDSTGKRLPFVQAGYALSALSKPMMALLAAPVWIFFARTTDRIGKGLRTGARDAMLSAEAAPGAKASVFGFHRSMDTLGAVIGPILALVYLYFYPENYITLFVLAFIPGTLSVLATLLLKDSGGRPIERKNKQVSFFSFLNYWKTAPPSYRKLVAGLLMFALINSSDVFLLLKAKEAGLNDALVIGIYIFYNLVYALAAFPMGVLADKWGIKRVFLFGLLLFAIVYSGMVFNNNTVGFLLLFFLYGLYAAATEGVAKAWISRISEKEDIATAIGTYAGLQSLAALFASATTGFIWFKFGAAAAFGVSAFITCLVMLYFFKLSRP